MKTLNVLLVALVVCFAITTATQAELTDLTGETYNAVFYNNNHTGSPGGSNTAPAANTTDLTYDTDFSTTQIYSGQVGLGTLTGTLVDFGGGATTVTLELDHGGSQLFAVSSSDPFTIGDPGHTVFDDVVGLGRDRRIQLAQRWHALSANHLFRPEDRWNAVRLRRYCQR